MAKLCIGMRVRILYSVGWPELAGQEGRIVDISLPGKSLDPDSEWHVAPDCWGTPMAPRPSARGGSLFAPTSSQLEPILPEGHKPCEEGFIKELSSLLSKVVA